MPDGARATDWTAYYEGSFIASRLTRRYTTSVLINAILKFGEPGNQGQRVAEIGGANSCFLEALRRRVRIAEYHVYDTNRFGLDLLGKSSGEAVHLHEQDVLTVGGPPDFDLVYSVGLIEHFDEKGTRTAIENNFKLARPGALVIISFPTPTLLYRAARGVAEATRQWKFPDERALRVEEVEPIMSLHGKMLHRELLWPIVLTQAMLVARKA